MKKATALIFSFLSVWALMLSFGLSARNPLTIAAFAGIAFLIFKTFDLSEPKGIVFIHLTAVLLAFFTFIVKIEAALSLYENKAFKLLCIMIMAGGLYLLFFHVLKLLACIIKPTDKIFYEKETIKPKSLWGISFAICFIAYLPWYLYSFPGIFSPDSIAQFGQVIGVNPLSNHHPICNTFVMWICYKIAGLFTSNVSDRAGLYTFVQMAFLSFGVSYVIYTLYKILKLKPVYCFIILAVYALTPYNAVLSILVGKDAMFGAIMMLFVSEVLRFVYTCNDEKKKITKVFDSIRFILFGIGMCLFRTNGFYAFILFAICFVLIFIKDWKKVLLRVGVILAVTLLIKGPVMNALDIKQPDIAESLHVPEQQISRIIVNDRDLTDYERTMLENVADLSYVKPFYVPSFADNIKELIRAGHQEVITEDKLEYAKLYVTLGLKYPADYLFAWKDLAEYIIYPEGNYDVAIIEGVYNNEIGVSHNGIIGGKVLLKLRELAVKVPNYIPVYGFLFSMGAFTWLFIISFMLILTNKKDRKRIVVLIPAIALILSLLLAIPSAGEFRYATSYILLAPFVLCIFKNINVSSNEGKQ